VCYYSGGVFLVKYDATGNQQWIRQFGSLEKYSSDIRYSITVDMNGVIYATGVIDRDVDEYEFISNSNP